MKQHSGLTSVVAGLLVRVAVVLFVFSLGNGTFSGDVNLYYLKAEGAVPANGELQASGLTNQSAQHLLDADVDTRMLGDQRLGGHYLPYRDFLWEFPPLTTVVLLLAPLTGFHYHLFRLLFAVTMMGLEATSLRLLVRSYPQQRKSITRCWYLTMVPLSAVAYFRLDYLAVYFATLALVRLGIGRRSVAAIFLGFAAKLWPVVFIVVLGAQRRLREALYASFACGLVLAAWWGFSPHGFHEFLRYRTGSGFQIESIPGSLLQLIGGHANHFRYGTLVVDSRSWHWVQAMLNGLVILVVGVSAVTAWRRNFNPIGLGALLTCALLLFSRLLSPQYLTWLGPFMVLVWPQSRRAVILFGVSVWLTLIELQVYDKVVNYVWWANGLVTIRNAVLVWLLLELVKITFPKKLNNQGIRSAATATL